MAGFLIDSYKVRLEIERFGKPVVTRQNRIIEIVSGVLHAGIVERAFLSFSTRWDNWSTTQAVGYYNVMNPYQPSPHRLAAVRGRILVLVRRLAFGETADVLLRIHADRRRQLRQQDLAWHVD